VIRCRYADCMNSEYKKLCRRRHMYLIVVKLIRTLWVFGVSTTVSLCLIFGILQLMPFLITTIVIFFVFEGALYHVKEHCIRRYDRADLLVRKWMIGGLDEGSRSIRGRSYLRGIDDFE
jgi:hypothetical protein